MVTILEGSRSVVFNEVHAQSKMLDTDEIDHLVHVLQKVSDVGSALFDALGQGENPPQTAMSDDGFNLVVRQVTRIVQHSTGVGMADQKRSGSHLQALKESLAIHVREVNNHAQPICLFDHLHPKIRQPATRAVFPDAVAELAAKIPHRLQRAQAKTVKIS